MRLSTKSRYGLKAMFELALNYGTGPIPLNNIAEKQNISQHYLEQLIAILRKEGLVTSVRGAQGGYMLSDHPKNITVGQIIKTLEGNIAPVECVIDDEMISCEKEIHCITKPIWIKIRDSINNVIESITLQDMLNDYEKMRSNDGYMYYI